MTMAKPQTLFSIKTQVLLKFFNNRGKKLKKETRFEQEKGFQPLNVAVEIGGGVLFYL
jgi:hypothetical protein